MVDTIERCVESVAAQTFRNYEHIVVDGASTDGTVEFLNSKRDYFSVLISEPDTGIYNAWNKALKHARGEWVLFLGADDILADKDVLGDVAGFIEEQGATSGIVYGDMVYVAKKNHEDRMKVEIRPEAIGEQTLLMVRPALPPHPATFHHRTLFNTRKFDESFKIAADSKLVSEALLIDKCIFLYCPRIINKMTLGGISTVFGLRTASENRRIADELKLSYSKCAMALAYAKVYFKYFILRALGQRNAYRLVDFFRKLIGKPPLYS